MKKLLGWAAVAMLVGMGMYFNLLHFGGVGKVVAVLVAITVTAGLSVVAVSASLGFCTSLATFVSLCFGFAFDEPAAALAFSFLFAAYYVSVDLKIKFRLIFVIYLIEGVGIYGSLKLGLWWPAAVAALFLGLWWLAVWLAEKKKLRLASV